VTHAQWVAVLPSAAFCGVLVEAEELAVAAAIGMTAAFAERHQPSVRKSNRIAIVFVWAIGKKSPQRRQKFREI
jgi:hypothetical protein